MVTGQADKPPDDPPKNANEPKYYFNNGYYNHDEKKDNKQDNQGEDVGYPFNFSDCPDNNRLKKSVVFCWFFLYQAPVS